MTVRQRVALCLAAACVYGVTSHAQPQTPQKGNQQGPRVAEEVSQRIGRGERVRVLVQLNQRQTRIALDVGETIVREPVPDVAARVLARVSRQSRARTFDSLPVVALTIDRADYDALLASPDVASIRADKLRKPLLSESVPLVGAPTAWAAGATGTGWAVAVVDTGVDKAHTFLAGKVVSEACYSTTDPAWSATSVCPGGVDGTGAGTGMPCDASISGCAHGTHMAGIAAGKSASFSGVAKDASLIAIQTYSKINSAAFCSPDPAPCVGAFDSDVLDGLERVYALRTTYNIGAALLALGSDSYASTCDTSVPDYKSAIDLLRSVNIPTVVSSGNSSSSETMQAPACVSTAISVGATSKADVLESYTNRSPVLKLLAPGTGIFSPAPGGGFSSFTGTSMAAAHVAGAWAILRQKTPTATVTTLLGALTSTGKPITDPENPAGTRPRIDVGAAAGGMTLTYDRLMTELPDLDGSNTSDLLWKNTSSAGLYATWLMNGTATVGTSVFGVDTSYQIFDFGDMNGDGRTDIIWNSTSQGVVIVWFMNGTTVTGFGSFGPPAGWSIRAVNDVNGDGRDDLIWESPATSRAAVWFMNGSTMVGSAVFDAATELTLAGANDLNNDGKADLIWRSEVTGAITIWFMNGSTVTSTTSLGVGAGWDLIATADGNGDGKADFYWRNPSNGALAIWFMNGGTIQSTGVWGVGSGWDVVAVGDLNGDNHADVFWRSPSTETLAYWFMNGATVASTHSFGVGSTWVPLVPE